MNSVQEESKMSVIDHFLQVKHKELKEELKQAKITMELCYAMLMGSVLLNVVLVWRLFNG